MGSALEGTVKALIEFEAELDRTKADVLAQKAKMIRDAEGIAESAKSSAVSKAQQQASERLAKARAEADREAESIRKHGVSSLNTFEVSVSSKKKRAAEMVVTALLGETR